MKPRIYKVILYIFSIFIIFNIGFEFLRALISDVHMFSWGELVKSTSAQIPIVISMILVNLWANRISIENGVIEYGSLRGSSRSIKIDVSKDYEVSNSYLWIVLTQGNMKIRIFKPVYANVDVRDLIRILVDAKV